MNRHRALAMHAAGLLIVLVGVSPRALASLDALLFLPENVVLHATQPDGRLVFAGSTWRDSVPTTPGALQTEFKAADCGFAPISSHNPGSRTYAPCAHGFLVIMDPNSGLVSYGTYVGGSFYDYVWAMTTDSVGDIYLAGTTGSSNFPFTRRLDARARRYGGWIAKFTRDGELVWAVEIDSRPERIARSSQSIIVAGTVADDEGANGSDVQVDRFDLDGQRTDSLRIGGTFNETPSALATEGDDVYVAGHTGSLPHFAHLAPHGRFRPFPVTALSETRGGTEMFVVKVRNGRLMWSSVFGRRSDDSVSSIGVRNGEVYFGGSTKWSPEWHMLGPWFQRVCFGKLTSDGTRFAYISYFGSGRQDSVDQAMVDDTGRLTIAGRTRDAEFQSKPAWLSPCSTAYYPAYSYPARFVARFDPSGTDLEFARLLPESYVTSHVLAYRRGERRALEPLPLESPCLVNAGSMRMGPIAPDMLFTIAASDLNSVERLLVDGQSARIVYQGPSQINAIAPIGLQAGKRVLVEALPAFSIQVDTVEASPAILTVDATGRGAAVAWNADGSRNSRNRPAVSCSTVAVLATGIGTKQLKAIGADGRDLPIVSVRSEEFGVSRVTVRLQDFHAASVASVYSLRFGNGRGFTDQGAFIYAVPRFPYASPKPCD